MEELGLFDLFYGISSLKKFKGRLEKLVPQSPAPKPLLDALSQVARGLERDLGKLECANSFIAAQRLNKLIEKSASRDKLVSGIEDLGARTKDELRAKNVYYIDASDSRFIEDASKWDKIKTSYPSAVIDIDEGLWCLALGRNTASVFHFVRCVEHGMRAIARAIRVKLKAHKRNIPLDEAEWNKIIEGIESKVASGMKGSRGPAKRRAMKFYGTAASDLRMLKDAYRNDVMHSRSSYSRPEAEACMFRVHSFMDVIIKKVPENHKGKISWSKP